MPGQLHAQAAHIDALLAQRGDLLQRLDRLARGDGVADGEQVPAVGHAGHAAHQRFVDVVVDAGAGVQDGQRVAHGAVGQAADELRRAGVEVDLLLPGDVGQAGGDVLRRDARKVIPLAAAEDGDGDFLHLGGGQDEDDMLGRFFHRFEQGVERLHREHVHLVDDVYFVAAHRRQVGDFVAQVADIVDAVVGGGVHLDNIEDRAAVDAFADLALAAGVRAGMVQAVDGLGENFGAGRLAGAARAGEQVGVADAAGGDLVLQRRDDGLLAHNVGKALRTPFAIQCAVHRHTPLRSLKKKAGRARGCAALHTDAGLPQHWASAA